MVVSHRVLVTSVGRRGQLVQWFKRHVGSEGAILAADASWSAPAAHLADAMFVVPPLTSDQYMSTLLDLCQQEGVTLVVPTIDTELESLASNKDAFGAIGTTVLVSDLETVRIAADKRLTHQWLRANSLPTPDQESVAAGSPWPPGLSFPFFVKPARGSRSVGARAVESPEDLPLSAPGVDMVAEQYVQGDEFTVSTYVNRGGRCIAAVPRQRLEVRDGEVSKGVTRTNGDLEELVREVAETLPGAWGPLNVQVIRDRNSGQMWIIEINTRFGGGDPLAWEAGADMPAWALAESAGLPTPHVCNWESGLTMLRFDDAIFLPWQE